MTKGLAVAIDLKSKLDEIDKQVMQNAYNGFYESRLGVLLGMWLKGKEVVHYRGVNCTTSFREMEIETGRDRRSLKKWNDLYEKYPEREEYLKIAEKKANTWTLKALLNKEILKEIDPPKYQSQPTVINTSISDFLQTIDDASVDLLITDPPYMTDVDDINQFVDWIPGAIKKLKSTGRAYIFIGAYPKEVFEYLNKLNSLSDLPFSIKNILIWTYRNTLGVKPKNDYIQNYQAILYIMGKEAPPLNNEILMEQISVFDFNHPARSANRHHSWEKPMELGEIFIRHSTKEGDTVIDTFAGTGTFILAAAKWNRRGIGCEINPDMIAICEERGCVIEK